MENDSQTQSLDLSLSTVGSVAVKRRRHNLSKVRRGTLIFVCDNVNTIQLHSCHQYKNFTLFYSCWQVGINFQSIDLLVGSTQNKPKSYIFFLKTNIGFFGWMIWMEK